MPEPPVGGPVIGNPRASPDKIKEIQERKAQSVANLRDVLVRWVTMRDGKVCPPCRAMHGRLVRRDNVPYVCLGTCRCRLVPAGARPSPPGPPGPSTAWDRYWEQRILELGADLHTWLMGLSAAELRELQHRWETLDRWEFEQWWHEEWRKWKEQQETSTAS